MSNLKVAHAAYSEDTGSLITDVYTFCKKGERRTSDSLRKPLCRTAALTVISFSIIKTAD